MLIPDAHGRVAMCGCCQLRQPVCLDAAGVTARVCGHCTHHQGQELVKRITRAESHERMLRERLLSCRTSEEHARIEAEEAREAMIAALESRGRLAARLVDAVDQDRNHGCAAQAIARDQTVIRWARRANGEDDLDSEGFPQSSRTRRVTRARLASQPLNPPPNRYRRSGS